MLKKKLNLLFFTLLLALLLGLSSISYAASMTKSEAFEYCRDNCGLAGLFNAPSQNNGNTLLTYNSFLTYLDNQSNNYMYVVKTSTSTSNTEFDIVFYDTFSINGNSYSASVNISRKGTKKRTYSFNNYYDTSATTTNGSAQGNFPTAANTFYMVYGNGEIIKASFELPPTGLQFTTSTDYITVNIGNESKADVIRVHKKSTIENPIWGIIENYNELNTWELYYGMYLVMPDGTEYVINDPYLEFMNNEQRYVRSKGLDIEIGKLYKLEITYEENLESYYYFIDDYFNQIPIGSTITYDYTSGDVQYTIQDQMQQQQQYQDDIMGFLTSSEVASGEQPTLGDISVPVVQDDTEDFFTWLRNSILNILYNNNDSTLEIPLYNTTHYIRSDIYKFNIEPLKTFIQAGWWFIVGVPVLKYIRRSIVRLKGGELPATDDKSDLLGNIL